MYLLNSNKLSYDHTMITIWYPKLITSFLLITILQFAYSPQLVSQDTFSIVAVDTVTGEIGSAGASCLGSFMGVGAFVISDVIESVGAIHTQAWYFPQNQNYAHSLMLLGLSPQQIIDSMMVHDYQNDPTVRQYGIVDLTRNGESAAFTGINCMDYKGHVTGKGYSIQGNILLGEIIIDTMHTIYLNSVGPLADVLMQTLEAAKIIGADTRCTPRGTSSQSAFIKVVRIGDGENFYLQEIVPDSPIGVDPIDILREQFDEWKDSLFTFVDPFLSELIVDKDSLPADGVSQANIDIVPKNNSDTLLSSGKQILLNNTGEGILSGITDIGNGHYAATITASLTIGVDTISAKVVSGTDTVEIFQKLELIYTTPVGVEDSEPNQIENYYLYQNYPQPFNPTTLIRYDLPRNSYVRLIVYDVLGNKIVTLLNEAKPVGTYEVTWNAVGLPSGVYFYQLKAGAFVETKKMLLLK